MLSAFIHRKNNFRSVFIVCLVSIACFSIYLWACGSVNLRYCIERILLCLWGAFRRFFVSSLTFSFLSPSILERVAWTSRIDWWKTVRLMGFGTTHAEIPDFIGYFVWNIWFAYKNNTCRRSLAIIIESSWPDSSGRRIYNNEFKVVRVYHTPSLLPLDIEIRL